MNAAIKTMAACACLFLAGCAAQQAPDNANAATSQNPALAKRADAYYARGRALQSAGQTAQAMQAWREALAIDPRHAQAGNALAVLQAQQADYPHAIALLRSLIDASPQDDSLHNNLGYAYMLSGDNQAALASLEKATALAPENARAWNNLASVLDKLGDPKGANLARTKAATLLAEQGQALRAEVSQLGSFRMGWPEGGVERSSAADSTR